MSLAIIAFTAQGARLGRKLADRLPDATLHVPSRMAQALEEPPYVDLADWTAHHWNRSQALIFVGASGIAVRAVAPHVADKFTDPAVISVDEKGHFVVPLLSGHVGGGNALAQRVADLVGGQAVISTATDVNGLFAVDVWAKNQGLVIQDREKAKLVSARLLEGEPVGFMSEFGHACPEGLTQEVTPLGVWVTNRKTGTPFSETLPLVPKSLVLGIGCRKNTPEETIQAVVDQVMEPFYFSAVHQVTSIDLKQEEPGLLAFCKRHHLPFQTYTAQELSRVEGDFTPSAFVASVTGVDNVCERSALLGGGRLLRPKFAKNGVTVAVAERNQL